MEWKVCQYFQQLRSNGKIKIEFRVQSEWVEAEAETHCSISVGGRMASGKKCVWRCFQECFSSAVVFLLIGPTLGRRLWLNDQ